MMRQKANRYQGAAAVEAAIVFPLLLLLTLGVIEYGWLFLKTHQITNAARYGARIAIRPGSTITDVINDVDSLMANADMQTSGYSVAFIPTDITSVEVGDPVEVKVTVPWANISLMNLSFLPTPANIGSSVTMAKEGP
jgi:Flp pilus assembly protein TadG